MAGTSQPDNGSTTELKVAPEGSLPLSTELSVAPEGSLPPSTDEQQGPVPPKSIFLFSDGTGNSSAKLFKTNVWRLYEALDLDSRSHECA